jgi:hypothetical protein
MSMIPQGNMQEDDDFCMDLIGGDLPPIAELPAVQPEVDENTINYVASRTLKKFHNSDKFVRGLTGPFGSGKSVGCCFEIIFRANRQAKAPDGKRYSRWVVIRNSYRELQDTTIKTWHDWFPEKMGQWREGTLTHTLEYNDVHLEVMFRALDRPDDVKKLLSLEVTGAWINEAKEVPKAILDGVQGRVGRYPSKRKGGASWFGVIMDTNLMDVDHWWYRIFEEERPITWEVFKQPSGMAEDAENVENLPPGYYNNLLVGHDQQWIDVYVHAKYGFIMDGKPVHPNFHTTNHVATTVLTPEPRAKIYAGIDFGRTPAIVFAQKINGQWRFLSEVVTFNMGATQFSKEVNTHINENYRGYEFAEITGDPAGEQKSQVDDNTPFDILWNNGISATPAFTNDVVIRRDTLGNLLLMNNMAGEPCILISPRCKTLVKGMAGGFKYKRVQVTGDEKYKDEPDKGQYSHVCEAAEYLLLGAGEDVSVTGTMSDSALDYSSIDQGII